MSAMQQIFTDKTSGMKETEIGWLPVEWELKSLKDILFPIAKKSRIVRIEEDKIYRLLKVRLYSRGIVLRADEKGYKIAAKFLYKTIKDDFIFSKIDARNGAWGFIPKNLEGGLVSGDFPILRLAEHKCNQKFLYFLFGKESAWIPLRNIAIGTTNRKRIQIPQLLNIKIPLPPLPEQKNIAAVLSSLQEAIEKTEDVIKSLREFKKSMMRHLFTYGSVTPEEAEQIKLKETEIGAMPEEWEIDKLEKVIQATQYGLSKRGNTEGQYPILRMNNLNDGKIYTHSLQFVDLDFKEFQKFKLNDGDVLFNRTNSFELVGKTSIFNFDNDFVFASYLVRVIPNQNLLNSEYLNYYLNMEATQKRLKLLATRGVSQSNINATKLRNFSIPHPPLPIQNQIAQILSSIDAKIRAEEDKKNTLDTLFKTLLENLMTGKIRVTSMETPL